MKGMQIYKVYPDIPEPLSFLEYLSRNLWWCWNHEAVELFYRMNPALWERVGKNPVAFLSRISQRRFEALSEDDSFIGHLNRVRGKFEKMFSDPLQIPELKLESRETIAYFSMEFGLHESLPFFAGGLGVLAGDHLKASSTLGLPLVGIGILYREGYFRQFLDHHGWQQESYPIVDVFDLPVQKVTKADGQDLILEIDGPMGLIRACVWQIKVGKIPLFMMDTDLLENPAQIREITSRLYASHSETRVAQEALLGIGGMKLLSALDIFPSVCHMNEGHCSFAGLERVSIIMDQFNLDMPAALQICRHSTVFTTHTPVSAGHDEFTKETVGPYLKHYCKKFNLDKDTLFSWGLPPDAPKDGKFSMFIFGACFAGFINGVSRLHGQVARKMWQSLWPKRDVEEVPISHVTNGVHVNSYISRQKGALFAKYLAGDWPGRLSEPRLVSRVDNIETSDLWHAHELDRSNLIRKSRQLLLEQNERRNEPRHVLEEVVDALDHHCLTICFARRFATYKRAGLLFMDIPRLTRLILDEERPIQIIIAGKAHPNDNEGKAILKKIVEFSKRHEVRHRVVFLENYDINIARYMVQGCDVWLNTPRRPYEACGTSGMKAAANGGLNLSILDGWWCEGFRMDRGWSIGSGEDYEDPDYQDAMESQALFNILENEVIPVFYDRKRGNPPINWVEMMKASMKMAMSEFSSDHMVREYSRRYYHPALANLRNLTADNGSKAKDLARTLSRLESLWSGIKLMNLQMVTDSEFKVGDQFSLTLEACLGDLKPEEVEVQIYHGRLRRSGHLEGSRPETMQMVQQIEPGCYLYKISVDCTDSGQFAYTARVIPSGDKMLRHTAGLITWAHADNPFG